ncbi:hypothetical protein HF650_12940 [Kosakonia sp. SMBL-WEM22]|uniref:hypothetical protein n=1 Tax=Kosakonia sp. SMBL-WEM22 TaxID=2725560 RepID=UPI0016599F04|nr:hypothetical protein [Kosakonia sp. SMBL-WEM22]QNQ20602.1 hypothetical protein HF650_12940 [Kosakonia sp. SMBL-WEM22]
MTYWKYINYVLAVPFLSVFLFMILRSIKNNQIARQIRNDGVYVNGTITAVVPGAPTTNGLVNITVDYFFVDNSGAIVSKEKVLTVVKTMDLDKYQVGATIPVIYLRVDSAKHILKETKGILEK